MDFNDSSESSENVLKSTAEEKNNACPADFISSASQEKTTAIGFDRFCASDDRISDYNSDGSFHSIETDEDDVTDSNIKTINGDSNEFADDSNNAEAVKSSFVIQSKNSNLICGGDNVENFLNDDAELVFSSGELKSRENPGLKFEESNISSGNTSTKDEDATSDSFFDEPSTDSPANTGHYSVENSIRSDEPEKSHSNDVVETNLSHDTRTDDLQTSIVDDVDESFSLDEVLEESECSERDQTRENCANDEHLTFDEDSTTSIEKDNSESLILENGDRSEKHQSCHSPSNNESVNSHEAESYSVSQEIVGDAVTVENSDNSEENVKISSECVENTFEENVENNSEEVTSTSLKIENDSENAGDFLPVNVPCSVDISTDNETWKCEAHPEKSENDVKSPSEENSLEATAEEAETIDSSGVTNDRTIDISLSKSQQSEDSPNHNVHSSVDPLERGDQNPATEDSMCSENSTHVPNDSVPSPHDESAPGGELTDTLSLVSDRPNEKEPFRENDQTAEPSTNPEEDSFVEELASDSTQELLRNLRRRVSSRRRNISEDSEPSLSDTSAHAESDSSMLTIETRNRTNNLRTRSKLTSRSSHSRSNWQPKINDVMSASSNFSICLEKVSETAPPDLDIKEEVIDESYETNDATVKKFNLVDFSIKLEKIEVDSDVEMLSRSRKSGPPTSGRSRRRSEQLRNRMRSRTATSRSGPTGRKVGGGPSTTTSAARRAAANVRADGRLSGREAARAAGKGASRVNGQMAKSAPAAKGASQARRNVRSLRSAGTIAETDRIQFLSMFNLRRRQDNGDESAKGILVKPRMRKARAKRVSFRLPAEERASATRNNRGGASRASKAGAEEARSTLQVLVPPLRYFEGDSRAESTVRGRSRAADRKRSAARTRSDEKVPIPAKRGRSSKVAEGKSEIADEVIDENPFEKLEALVDAARKTVDVWFECQCCNQKYYLLENTKRHVRTHFPNCLTN